MNAFAQHKEFPVFNAVELVVGIAVPGRNHTCKEIDDMIDWVKRPQKVQVNGLKPNVTNIWYYKSSVDKFYNQGDESNWVKNYGCQTWRYAICIVHLHTKQQEHNFFSHAWNWQTIRFLPLSLSLFMRNPAEFCNLMGSWLSIIRIGWRKRTPYKWCTTIYFSKTRRLVCLKPILEK